MGGTTPGPVGMGGTTPGPVGGAGGAGCCVMLGATMVGAATGAGAIAGGPHEVGLGMPILKTYGHKA